jgi:Flp pilus assembly protein TadG
MKKSSQRGATLIEAAVSMMLFFTLILGIFEFARAYNVYQTAANAAREGARFSVAPLPGTNTLPSNDQVVARTQQFLDMARVKGATVTANQTLTGPEVSAFVTVYTEVDVSVPWKSFLIGGSNYTISAKAMMRNELN